MILASLLFVAAAAEPSVEWTAPRVYLPDGACAAQVTITTGDARAEVPVWLMDVGAFTVNGQPLGKRSEGKLTLAPRSKLTLEVDLREAIARLDLPKGGPIRLNYAPDYLEGKEVTVPQAAEKGLDFMTMPAEDLSKFHVVLQTNRGDMEAEFWPDVAPNHVRNFLDLSYTGFYDGVIFHRVIPGFMIQGGDPTGTGTGDGKRKLQAEFNSRKHEPGVLSMARSADPNSASCQFFVMHKTSPHLDGQYSAFGKLISGLDVVEMIVTSKRDGRDKPIEPQTILKAVVVRTGS